MLGAARGARSGGRGDAAAVVDTVGAGDTFDAGLVAGLAQGLDLRGALRLAVAAGTLSVRAVGGADGQPDLRRGRPPASGRRGRRRRGVSMRQEDRLGQILDRLSSDGTVGVTDLAADLGVSVASVRRDLQLLEDQHLLSRTHGGAVSSGVLYELPDALPRRPAPG